MSGGVKGVKEVRRGWESEGGGRSEEVSGGVKWVEEVRRGWGSEGGGRGGGRCEGR